MCESSLYDVLSTWSSMGDIRRRREYRIIPPFRELSIIYIMRSPSTSVTSILLNPPIPDRASTHLSQLSLSLLLLLAAPSCCSFLLLLLAAPSCCSFLLLLLAAPSCCSFFLLSLSIASLLSSSCLIRSFSALASNSRILASSRFFNARRAAARSLSCYFRRISAFASFSGTTFASISRRASVTSRSFLASSASCIALFSSFSAIFEALTFSPLMASKRSSSSSACLLSV